MAPTLKDVAQLAGVSTTTVARVVHSRGAVSAKTRAKVEAALERTGYQINAVAQGLRKQQNSTIGLVVTCFMPNPFFAGVAKGVEHEASINGYNVIISDAELDNDKEKHAVETLVQRRVSAIIFAVARDPRSVTIAVNAGIPAVQVERVTTTPSHSVTMDNWMGASLAVEHLIAFGHRDIAFIGGNVGRNPNLSQSWRSVEEQRWAGYVDTLRRYNISVREELVVQGENYTSELDVRGPSGEGYRCAKEVLKHRPTAIFATCDILAAGVLQAIYEAGLRVPEDVSVVGYDDTFAPYLTPPLTTISHPTFEVGRAAVNLAITQLDRDNGSANTYLSEEIKPRLVVRHSTNQAKEVTATIT